MRLRSCNDIVQSLISNLSPKGLKEGGLFAGFIYAIHVALPKVQKNHVVAALTERAVCEAVYVERSKVCGGMRSVVQRKHNDRVQCAPSLG